MLRQNCTKGFHKNVNKLATFKLKKKSVLLLIENNVITKKTS